MCCWSVRHGLKTNASMMHLVLLKLVSVLKAFQLNRWHATLVDRIWQASSRRLRPSQLWRFISTHFIVSLIAYLARVFKDRQSLMHATLLLLQIPSASWTVASYFVHVCTFCAIFFDAWLLISKLQDLESCEGISLAQTRALRWSHEDSWSKSFFFIGLLL